MQRIPKVIAIVGPTASGKTKLSLGLAKEFDGEIIAVDSRTMYRGMDIGTAKPTEKEQHQIPHYMLDVTNPDKSLTASQYQKLATEMIFEISDRGKIPFLVGGTGLYLDAIVYGFQMPPEGNPALRIQLEKLSLDELAEKFQKLDPDGAKKIDDKNKRRLIRAVEVCLLTGKPFSEQKKKVNPGFKTLLLGIEVPKEKLVSHISARIDEMIKDGLVEEVRKLSMMYNWDLPAMSSLGYREIGNYLVGKISLDEATEVLKKNTIDYARRQLVWFKKNKDIVWVKDKDEAEEKILEFLRG